MITELGRGRTEVQTSGKQGMVSNHDKGLRSGHQLSAINLRAPQRLGFLKHDCGFPDILHLPISTRKKPLDKMLLADSWY